MNARGALLLGTALAALVVAALPLGGCGGEAAIVPADIAGTWVVVLNDADGHPQEGFCFDVLRNGQAMTATRTVGTCDAAALLTLSFSGWEGGTVTGSVQLTNAGSGAGNWSRTLVSPASGAATCVRAAHQTTTGIYRLAYDGGAPSTETLTITSDGYTMIGGLVVGVVQQGGAITIAVRGGPGGATGPVVFSGTLAATITGTYVDHLGNQGTWTGTPTPE